jgi:acetyltransferase
MLELTRRLGFKREGGRSGEPDIRVVKPTASL